MAKKSLNKMMLSGNLGKDPVIRKTAEGAAVATASLAVNDYNGNTSWANLVAFNKQAELMRDHLHKGDGIIVVGRYQIREYDKDGETRYSHECVVEDITFMPGGKPTENGSKTITNTYGAEDDDTPARKTTTKRTAKATSDDDSDDIPF